MKNFLLFGLLYIQVANAQKFSMDISYQYMYAKQWDRSIQLYNFSRPWLIEKQPLLIHGMNMGFNSALSIKQKLNHGLSGDLSFFSSSAANLNVLNTVHLFLGNIGYFAHKQMTIQSSSLYVEARVAMTISGLFRRTNQAPLLLDDKQVRAFGIGSQLQVKLGYYLPFFEGVKSSLFVAIAYHPYIYSPYGESVLNQTMGITNHYGTGVVSAKIGFRTTF